MTPQTRISERLRDLRREYDEGQAALANLELQETRLRERLLMLRGAVSVLEELRADLDAAGATVADDGSAEGQRTSVRQ